MFIVVFIMLERCNTKINYYGLKLNNYYLEYVVNYTPNFVIQPLFWCTMYNKLNKLPMYKFLCILEPP